MNKFGSDPHVEQIPFLGGMIMICLRNNFINN
jgi:hypothetical protein